jgi:hypothetical protein
MSTLVAPSRITRSPERPNGDVIAEQMQIAFARSERLKAARLRDNAASIARGEALLVSASPSSNGATVPVPVPAPAPTLIGTFGGLGPFFWEFYPGHEVMLLGTNLGRHAGSVSIEYRDYQNSVVREQCPVLPRTGNPQELEWHNGGIRFRIPATLSGFTTVTAKFIVRLRDGQEVVYDRVGLRPFLIPQHLDLQTVPGLRSICAQSQFPVERSGHSCRLAGDGMSPTLEGRHETIDYVEAEDAIPSTPLRHGWSVFYSAFVDSRTQTFGRTLNSPEAFEVRSLELPQYGEESIRFRVAYMVRGWDIFNFGDGPETYAGGAVPGGPSGGGGVPLPGAYDYDLNVVIWGPLGVPAI